jgi:hypothetical protein
MVGRRLSVVVASATDGPPGRAEDPENHPEDHRDAPEQPEKAKLRNGDSDDQQADTERNLISILHATPRDHAGPVV